MKQYILNWLLWYDEGLNTLTGGDPGETVSSRAAKAQVEGKRWGCVLCKFLDWLQKDHCKTSLNADDGRRAVVKD
jgi:hypothetical protein